MVKFNGAGNRVRTGDLNLGKVALYQLSYSRGRVILAQHNGFSILLSLNLISIIQDPL